MKYKANEHFISIRNETVINFWIAREKSYLYYAGNVVKFHIWNKNISSVLDNCISQKSFKKDELKTLFVVVRIYLGFEKTMWTMNSMRSVVIDNLNVKVTQGVELTRKTWQISSSVWHIHLGRFTSIRLYTSYKLLLPNANPKFICAHFYIE